MWTRPPIGQTLRMNFRLEAWEVPPDADASNLSVPIEFGPIEWQGAPTMISARWLELPSGEALAFFHAHSCAMNFVVTLGDGTTLIRLRKHINSKNLGNIVRIALHGGRFHFGRLFYCGGEALVLGNEKAHWSASDDFFQREFALVLPFDAQNEPSTNIWHWLQEQWHDLNSAVRLSWEWSRKNDLEKVQFFDSIVPRWREVHDLMNAVAITVELPVGAHWILDHVDTHNQTPELLGRLQPWREIFIAQFSFELLPDSYPQFLREYFRVASAHVQVVGQAATAHQQLEARLFLRDWLQRHAPDHLHLVQ